MQNPGTEVLTPTGRLDHHGSAELSAQLQGCKREERPHLVLDMSAVSYISSAALRVLVMEMKARQAGGGTLTLCGLQSYALNVIRIAGLEKALRICEDLPAALGAGGAGQAGGEPADWTRAESTQGEWGRLRWLPGSGQPGGVEIAGDIEDVLAARVSPAHVFSKRFSHKAYSIGLGGLGGALEDYYPLMGEMMTVGGSMVWLPCDGHGVPDFLIPKNDQGQVLLRSGFNVSLSGAFNEYLLFESARPEGESIEGLYRILFDQARERRPDFKGAIGLAMRCQMPGLYGAGVVKAPVVENRPANGQPITAAENFGEWFEFDKTPRHQDVTGLIVGLGVDLSADHSAYDPDNFRRTFYINPANDEAAGETLIKAGQGKSPSMSLHNHVVAFDPMPMPENHFTLEGEIQRVLDEGRFRDMRHLLDASTISRAVIGVIYVQDFFDDTDLVAGHAA